MGHVIEALMLSIKSHLLSIIRTMFALSVMDMWFTLKKKTKLIIFLKKSPSI